MISHQQYVDLMKAARPDIEVISKYEGSKKQIKLRLVCGHEVETKPCDIRPTTKYKFGCQRCTMKEVGGCPPLLTNEGIKKRLVESGKSHIRFVKRCKGLGQKARFYCNKCKVYFKANVQFMMRAKYGCSKCSQQRIGYKRQKIRIQGRLFSLQGNEPQALKYLLRVKGVSIEDLLSGRYVKRFYYKFGDTKERSYYPDFQIKSMRRIVEVKSNYTLAGRKDWYEKLLAKRAAVLKEDYKFTLIVYDEKKKRVDLPKKWYELTYVELSNALNLKWGKIP